MGDDINGSEEGGGVSSQTYFKGSIGLGGWLLLGEVWCGGDDGAISGDSGGSHGFPWSVRCLVRILCKNFELFTHATY